MTDRKNYQDDFAYLKQDSSGDRRSQDPVNQLSRLLDTLCVEAASEHEIVAHLESLGYNSHRVQQEFNRENVFDLASEMFRRTPRKIREKSFASVEGRPLWLRHIIMLCAIIAALFMSGITGKAWVILLWVICWSFMGNFLIGKAPSERPESEHKAVTGAILYLGLFGFALLFMLFPLGLRELSLGIFWWALARWTWQPRFKDHHKDILMGLVPVITLTLALLLRANSQLIFGVVVITALAMTYDLLAWPKAAIWRWLYQKASQVLPVALYGLGQGLLLISLLRQPDWNLIGIGLVVMMLLGAEHLVTWLRHMLKNLLWDTEVRSRRNYQMMVWSAVMRYALPFLLIFVPIIALAVRGWSFGSLLSLSNFALFGFSLACALALSSLNDATPMYLIFLAAGVLSLLPIPLVLIMLALAIALFIRLLWHAKRVEYYGIYLF
ncbi:MAG: hypothetical protein R2880_11540 [Deinococcales bacterium]